MLSASAAKSVFRISGLTRFASSKLRAVGDNQNGNSDKDRELPKMAGIYRGAILTIFAASASSADEGFLQDRDLYDSGLTRPVRLNGRYDIAQLLKRGYRWVEESVDTRAWTLQEHLLPSRVLRLITDAIEWHCQCMDLYTSQEGESSIEGLSERARRRD